MDMNPKAIAGRLLKLANDLEARAMDASYFVCGSCNHTATLATINSKRAKVASSRGIAKVKPVSVNEKIGCPACEGTMSYVPTADSKKFYVEAGVDILDAMDLVNAEKKKKEDVFSPVDEQPKPEGEMDAPIDDQPKPEEGEGAPMEDQPKPEGDGVPELDMSFGESAPDKNPEGEPSESTPDMEDKALPVDDGKTPPPAEDAEMDYDSIGNEPEDAPKMDEGAPEDKPEDMPEDKPEDMPEDAPKMDEGVPEDKPEDAPEVGGEDALKAPDMSGDTPAMPTDDETPPEDGESPRGTSLEEPPSDGMEPSPVSEEEPMPEDKPKKKKKEKEVTDIPRFEKMPKDASEDFLRAVNKYASF